MAKVEPREAVRKRVFGSPPHEKRHFVTIAVGKVAKEEEQMHDRGIVRQALGLGVLVTLTGLALDACGGRGGQEEAKARPLPEGPKTLRSGEYRSEEFKPSLSFRVGKGWEVSELQQKPYFDISHEYQGDDDFVAISFNNPPPGGQWPKAPQQACARSRGLGLLV